MFDLPDEAIPLPGLDPVADAAACLSRLEPPPWRADHPGRGWLLAPAAMPCAWCARTTTTLVGTVTVTSDGHADIDACAVHPNCETGHFAHGTRVAEQLVDILTSRLNALDTWTELSARGPFGPAARRLGADLIASDGVFVLPWQAGHRLLDTPVPCRRCTLPAYASVHLAGLDVVGPQHWDCLEARSYQGLDVVTLADELYPG